MKLSINQGPFVGKERFNFSISSKRCREIGDFLWSWYDSLPKDVQDLVEVITVNPYSRPVPNTVTKWVTIKVVLSEKYPCNIESTWSVQFTTSFTLPFDDEASAFNEVSIAEVSFNNGKAESVARDLYKKLFEKLRTEADARQKTYLKICDFVGSLDRKAIPF